MISGIIKVEVSVGLSTSCSRFPKKFPVFSQNVAQKLLKKSQKLLKKTKPSFLFLSSFI